MADIAIARYDANTGWLPPVCPKHGRPAQSRGQVRYYTKPPAWVAFTVFAGLLIYLAVMNSNRACDLVHMPRCADCAEFRHRLKWTRRALFVAPLPLFMLAVVTDNVVVLVLWGLTVSAWLLSLLSSVNTLNDIRGFLDGPWLRLKGVHPAFVAAVRPNPAWQQVHYAAQPPPR